MSKMNIEVIKGTWNSIQVRDDNKVKCFYTLEDANQFISNRELAASTKLDNDRSEKVCTLTLNGVLTF